MDIGKGSVGTTSYKIRFVEKGDMYLRGEEVWTYLGNIQDKEFEEIRNKIGKQNN